MCRRWILDPKCRGQGCHHGDRMRFGGRILVGFCGLKLVRFLIIVAGSAVCGWSSDWPTPPAQSTSWDPPADHLVYPKLDHACQLMFDAGMPDPRGCEYCAISVPVYDDGWGPWDERVPVPSERLHGWLLPEPMSTQMPRPWFQCLPRLMPKIVGGALMPRTSLRAAIS